MTPSGRTGDRRRPLARAVLVAVPFLLLGLWSFVLARKGPYWLGTNLDPDYAYLMNGLGLLHGQVPGHVDHPGTPVQIVVAVVMGVTRLATGSGSVAEAVLRHPDRFLRITNVVLLLLFAGSLVVAGLVTLRRTRSLAAALAMQLLPGLSPVIALQLVCVKPEPLLATLTALVSALVLARLAPDRVEGRVPDAALFGLLVGLSIATKINAAPLALLPLLLLRGLAPRAVFAGTTVATMAVATVPAWPALGAFRRFVTGIATHSGRYGLGKEALLDAREYAEGLALLAGTDAGVPIAVGAVGGGVALLLHLRSRRTPGAALLAARDALAATVATQAGAYLLVARHASRHYLLVALVLSGLALALAIHGIRLLVPGGSRVLRLVDLACAGGVVLCVAWLVPGLEEGLRKLESDREAQLEIVRTVESRYAGRRIVHYYRSSSPAYALHFGDAYAGSHRAKEIVDLHPGHLFYNRWEGRIETFRIVPGVGKAETMVYEALTRRLVCGGEGETPVLFQGSAIEDVPTLHSLGGRDGPAFQVVHSSSLEGLYRPTLCPEARTDGAAP